ncbi:reverse transcriptase domain-containing protein [Tanacetum coccineum]|uniref:Reverse transcriptase domain-containing protein n=1 Tax=Tanacetum coccineum TaxID=301880 RepID=A0ABQ5GW08_9ASTR
MDELLRIPILGIESDIVIPAVLADEFEIKPTLIDFIRAAETWLDKEPPNSITSWDDLVLKFLNRFYLHSKTRAVRREITDFQQVFGETFTEAWERFNDLLRESSGNLMTKNTQEALIIIERKARVRTYINKYVQEEQGVQKEQEEQAAQKNSSNAITPYLSTKEPNNSLIMRDEHLDTISEMESGEVIKSSVEDLVPIPREESLLNRDTPIVYSPKIDFLAPINLIPPGILEADFDPKEDIRLDDQMFYDYTLSDDDSFEDIDYVEASPLDSELVSIEEVEDDILHAKLSNIYLLIAKIASLDDNPTPSFLSHSDNSLPEFKTFSNHTEEMRSGSTTTHAENSLPEYDSFHFKIESDQGELSKVVMETIDEIDAFLDIGVSTDLEDGYHNSKGDIIYLESLLINNTIPNFSLEDCPDFEDSCARCFVHRSLAL